MNKDEKNVNKHGKEDQGGRRPRAKPDEAKDENETTGYGKNRKPQDEKKSGSGLEEFLERQNEKDDTKD